MSKILSYLNKYYRMQDKIIVCYRPTLKNSWADRCLYLSEDFDQLKTYNHRSILKNEVIFEWDEEDRTANRKNCDVVASRLKKEGYQVAKWESGNKSTHLHTFIDTAGASSVALLKKCFIRYFSEGLPLPDLRLCSENHLIRAEYGIHEKTGRHKTLISKSGLYPKVKKVKKPVWDMYVEKMHINMKRKHSTEFKDLTDHPIIKLFLNNDKIRALGDGRERILFCLIHVLKPKYKDRKEEFIKFLQEWYRYSSGRKLNDMSIASKVHYHWKKSYTITIDYVHDLAEELNLK